MDEIPKAGGQVTAPRSHGASQTADCPAMGAKIETVGESGFDRVLPFGPPPPRDTERLVGRGRARGDAGDW